MKCINNETPQFEYGFYTDKRRECVQKFGSIFSLPIVSNPYSEMVQSYTEGNVLDIGAGKEKPLYNAIKSKLNNGKYYSLDSDPNGQFDFTGVEKIPEELRFSIICANQFFEHLEIQESIDIIYKVSKHLASKGKIIATVPNMAHPNRYHADITHKTFWSYNGFYIIFKYANLEVTKIARYSKYHPKGFMEKLITKYVSKIYRLDWCDSILIKGEKID